MDYCEYCDKPIGDYHIFSEYCSGYQDYVINPYAFSMRGTIEKQWLCPGMVVAVPRHGPRIKDEHLTVDVTP